MRRLGFSGGCESNENIVIRVGAGRARSVGLRDADPRIKPADALSHPRRRGPQIAVSRLNLRMTRAAGVRSSAGRKSIPPFPSTIVSPHRWLGDVLQRTRGRDGRSTRCLRVLPTTYETRGRMIRDRGSQQSDRFRDIFVVEGI